MPLPLPVEIEVYKERGDLMPVCKTRRSLRNLTDGKKCVCQQPVFVQQQFIGRRPIFGRPLFGPRPIFGRRPIFGPRPLIGPRGFVWQWNDAHPDYPFESNPWVFCFVVHVKGQGDNVL